MRDQLWTRRSTTPPGSLTLAFPPRRLHCVRRMDHLSHDGFGHYLAGLVDGEGCFTISPNRPGFACRLSLSLREDDAAILHVIRERTRVGKILTRPPQTSEVKRRAQTVWRVQKKAECQTIVAIFDRFPLRAKKARDYSVWREAVLDMAAMDSIVMNGVWRRTAQDWTRVAALRDLLRQARDGDDIAIPLAGVARSPRPGSSTGSGSLHR